MFKYKVQYYSIRIVMGILCLFPESFRFKFAELVAIIGYHLIKKRRMIALANLNIAFPEKSEKEKIVLAKKNYKILTKAYMASLWLEDFVYDDKKVLVENKELLDEAVGEGKGVMIAGIHMGSIEAALHLTKYYNFHTVAKKQRNPYINEFINKKREQLNIKVLIKDKQTSRKLMRVIRNKEVLTLFADHRDKGANITFFGRETVAPTGAIHLALKFDLPLLLVHPTLTEDNINIVHIAKRIELIKTDNLKNDVQVNTQNLIYEMEKIITKYPEQWMWFHDRWKMWKVIK